MTTNKNSKFKVFGGVEKASIVAVFLLVIVNLLIQQTQVAVGIAVGGVLFLADFAAIKFIVNSILTKRYSTQFSIFLFVVKLIILLAILLVLLKFAKLNIYGFIIALTAIVFVIVGSGLKGNNNGTF
ncbi:MAG: ATP synthase subunit I [Thermodesulfobacteriota bacterium]